MPVTPLWIALVSVLIMSLTAYLLHLKQLIGSLSVLSNMVLFFFLIWRLSVQIFFEAKEGQGKL